jgi:hypothetical protein
MKNSMDEEQQNKKHKFGWLAIVMLVLIAFVCDLLGLIPFVKDVLGTIFWIGASIYFYMIGMGFLNGRRLATMAISWIASVIPVIQEIPLELVAGIIVIIVITRVEEKTGLSLTSGLLSGELHGNYAPQITQRSARTFAPLNKDGSRGPVNTRVPLNQNGVRAPRKESESDTKRRERSERMSENLKRSRELDLEIAQHRSEKLGLNEKGKYAVNKEGKAEYVFGKRRGDGDFSSDKGKFIKNEAGETVFRSHDELKEAADSNLHPSAQIPKFDRNEETGNDTEEA